MRISTVFTRRIFKTIKNYMIDHKPKEALVIAGCGLSSSCQHTRLLPKKVFLPRSEDYEVQAPYAVQVKKAWYHGVLSDCAEHQLHPLLMHMHPFEDGYPHESPIDATTEKRDCAEISRAMRGSLIATMVANSDCSAFDAHIYDRPHDQRVPMQKILVPEQGHLKCFIPTFAPQDSIRSQRADYQEYNSRLAWGFGDAVADMFARFHFVVVGSGGLGEDAAVQLVNLGAEVTVVDTDIFQNVNETRSRYGNHTYAMKHLPKVELTRLACLQSQPDAIVHTLLGDIRDESTQKEIIKADGMVVGTDNITSRLVASRLAMTHGMLLFDMGTGIAVQKGQLVSVRGQVMKLMPGLSLCHECAEFFDVKKGYNGFLNEQDYVFMRQKGYIDDPNVKVPQVMPVNSVMTGACIWEILRYFSGATPEHLSDVVTFDLLKNTSEPHLYERRSDGSRAGCAVCEQGDFLTGDQAPFLCRHQNSAVSDFLKTRHKGKRFHGTTDTSKHRPGSTSGLATR